MATKPRLHELPISAGNLHVSTNANEVLVVHGLGSCVGVAITDPDAGVAGLAHVFLPDSRTLTDRQRRTPWTCANDAIPELLRQVLRHGGKLGRLSVVLAGGSCVGVGDEESGVGQQNQTACLEALRQAGVRVQASFLGGSNWRTIKIFVASGEVAVMTSERIDLVDHPGRPGLADACLGKTRLSSVDDVVDCLASLADQSPTEPQPRSTVRPQNADEISQLLNHLVRDPVPPRTTHRTGGATTPPATPASAHEDLSTLLGPLLDAKNRQAES